MPLHHTPWPQETVSALIVPKWRTPGCKISTPCFHMPKHQNGEAVHSPFQDAVGPSRRCGCYFSWMHRPTQQVSTLRVGDLCGMGVPPFSSWRDSPPFPRCNSRGQNISTRPSPRCSSAGQKVPTRPFSRCRGPGQKVSTPLPRCSSPGLRGLCASPGTLAAAGPPCRIADPA